MQWSEEALAARLRENPSLKVSPANQSLRGNLRERGDRATSVDLLGTKTPKYRAQRTEYNGIKFASKKEARHAQDNDTRIKAGILSFYLMQLPFHLPGGIVYRADFAEFSRVANTELFEVHFVDVKGFRTKEYIMKKKQVKALYSIEIEEV